MRGSIVGSGRVVLFALLLASIAGARAPGDGSPAGPTASDWAGIRAAHDAQRYAARPAGDGYELPNPAQRWRTTFDGRGCTTRPDAGGWEWGLELVSYGCADRERVVERAETSAQGARVTRAWDPALDEWYENDARGLEHGYTVHARPSGAAETLVFRLAVRGTLRPMTDADGRGVRFVDAEGAVVLTYSGLTAFDADGRALPASLALSCEGLALTVDERGARYPVTIDPLVQQAYLKAAFTGPGDGFGASVAVSGDTVVVGAPFEDSNATGVNGNESDNSASIAGAAYVFVRNGTTWSQEAYLKASNTGSGDLFGVSVAVSGDTAVVGANAEDSGATGVNGNGSDNGAVVAGAAYVFVRDGTTWSQEAYLKASNTGAGDRFGFSVAVSGDTAVVGAYWEDSGATGVNGDQSDNGASAAGAAYVFVRSGTDWSQEAYLKSVNTEAGDFFGASVAVSGDTVVVGANREDGSATGVNGNWLDNGASNAGAAYAFTRSGTTWSAEAYLKASNTGAGDDFGRAVSVSGDTVVVGAPAEYSSATGVNGNQGDDGAPGAGAAYVFVHSGTTWSQQAYLKASNTDAGDEFGRAVSVSGDSVVVGAPYEDSSATGTNGNEGDDGAADAGAAYAYVRSGTTWTQSSYVKASNTDAGDLFGFAVSASGDGAVVGAYQEDSSGNPRDDSSSNAGAAYVLEDVCVPFIPSAEVVRLGSPPNPTALLAGLTSGPVIGSIWDPVVDHSSFAPFAFVDILAISALPANLPLAFGTLLIDLSAPAFILILSGPPSVPFAVPVPLNCDIVGVALYSQASSIDFIGTFELTNALDLTIGAF